MGIVAFSYRVEGGTGADSDAINRRIAEGMSNPSARRRAHRMLSECSPAGRRQGK
jgi:hypothetical protein